MTVSFVVGKKLLQGASSGATGQILQITMTGKAVLSVFVMVLPLAVLFSAALLAIALFAKSFKEAQSYISPLMIVVVLPAVAAVLPGVNSIPRLRSCPC